MAKAKPPTKAKVDASFVQLLAHLDAWTIAAGALDRVHDAARSSLAEVKALTEYQDGKASRLLTVVAFLSALVAAVFTRFAGDYHWPRGQDHASPDFWLPVLTYAVFLAYVVLVTLAVLIVINAIKPTFNEPLTWTGTGSSGRPRSMLFFERILDVTPPAWGQAFEGMAGQDGAELKALYAKNYISEAYLVARKVAEKLARLKIGIALLEGALCILVLFFLLIAATTVFVDPAKAPAVTTLPSPPTMGGHAAPPS